MQQSKPLANKYIEFEKAMNTYHNNVFYNKFGTVVAISIIMLQIITLINLNWKVHLSFIIYFLIAYVLTDLINGLVHMYMDNNTNYTSIVGPLIAAFHLHHKKPKYKNSNIISVYFFETGAKNWLVIYLLLVVYLQIHFKIPASYNFILVCIGILSSISEVSHYLCHNSNNRLVKLLQKLYILLPPAHHSKHHYQDNKNYAFLNGVSDPLLNKIAAYRYDGYKNNSDLHVKSYTGLLTKNR